MSQNQNPAPRHPTVPRAVQSRTAKRLENEVLLCRMMRHNWEEYTPLQDEVKSIAWGTPVGWRCTRCGTKRIDVYDRLGEVSWRNYIYRDGYSVTADETPRAPALRVEFINRKQHKGGSK